MPEHECKQYFAALSPDNGVHLDDADLWSNGYESLKVGERPPDAEAAERKTVYASRGGGRRRRR